MTFNTVETPVKGINLPAVRTLQKVPSLSFFVSDQYFEKINVIGLEGSSVTLLGLVKYDSQNDYYHLSQLSAIIAGGVKECRNVLKN